MKNIGATRKKLVVVDLDNTLWQGVVGENGLRSLTMSSKHRKLQENLKELGRRGVLLAILSKNEESIALEAISSYSDMLLTLDDFVTWRINWESKSTNMTSILSELNFGEEAVLFIDDSPQERDLINQFFPGIEVAEHLSLDWFSVKSITEEDIHRLQMYKVERERRRRREKFDSMDEWLRSLDTEVRIGKLNKNNLPRVVQLLNKTNQMNLTTRRLSAQRLLGWLDKKKRGLWTFHMTDKFGDGGIVGLITTDRSRHPFIMKIRDFVLSCRVFGRDIEKVMLATVIDSARTHGVGEVLATYIPTKRNSPCLDFWENQSGFKEIAPKRFCWLLNKSYLVPEHVKVSYEEE